MKEDKQAYRNANLLCKLADTHLYQNTDAKYYSMSPYLIIDNELCQAIENAAMRGIDVRIVTPHIPDKQIIFVMTRSYYKRLMNAGVKIY